jgi:hypothetical protein
MREESAMRSRSVRKSAHHVASRAPAHARSNVNPLADLAGAGTIVRPVQFGDIWYRGRCRRQAERLALAVVAQAADDLAKYRGAPRRRRARLYRTAYEWVTSDDRSWPYSFVNLCEALRLSPSALRAELLDDSRRRAAETV